MMKNEKKLDLRKIFDQFELNETFEEVFDKYQFLNNSTSNKIEVIAYANFRRVIVQPILEMIDEQNKIIENQQNTINNLRERVKNLEHKTSGLGVIKAMNTRLCK